MIRVLMIGWEYPPHIAGGLGIACRGISRALVRRGHRVRFLMPRLFGDEATESGIELVDIKSSLDLLTPEEREELEEIRRRKGRVRPAHYFFTYRSSDYQPPHGIPWRDPRWPLESGGSENAPILEGGYGEYLYREIHDYARIAAMLATKFECDLIHVHDWMTFPAGLAAAAAVRRPLICHVHATEFDRCGPGINQAVYDLEREAFHACPQVIAVSEYTRNILVERYGVAADKISVVYNGVDLDEIEGPRSEEDERPIRDKIVLFLGRMTLQKGPDYFIRAAQLVIEKNKRVRFVMAGVGDMYYRMIELAAELGIGGHFHYTGALDRSEVRRIYRMSDLYIMPSVSEPFGITPLEAISHGVPVILSRQSGVSEVLHGCEKVDFWNVDELASRILSLLENSEYARTMRDEALRELKEITWDHSARRLEEVYGGVLARANEGIGITVPPG